jgi:hypothetical protein
MGSDATMHEQHLEEFQRHVSTFKGFNKDTANDEIIK